MPSLSSTVKSGAASWASSVEPRFSPAYSALNFWYSTAATAKTATSRTAIPARARFFFFAFISSPPYDSSARNLPKSPVAISTPMATKKPPLTRLITR